MLIDPFTKKLLSGNNRNKPISLMYHSITHDKPSSKTPWSISLKQFIRQLDLLHDYGWTSICAQQLSTPINPLPEKSVVITFDDGFADNYSAFEELVKRDMLASWFIVTQDIGKISSWADPDTSPAKLLNKHQLITMQEAGMEIGSHSHSHYRLTTISSEQIKKELSDSRNILSDLLKNSITSFAYPYGLYNKAILLATKSAGYQTAFTTNSGFGLVNNNPLEVRRVAVLSTDSLSTFARKLTFADNNVSWQKMCRYGFSRIASRLNLSQ